MLFNDNLLVDKNAIVNQCYFTRWPLRDLNDILDKEISAAMILTM